jgi:hypothetical protein
VIRDAATTIVGEEVRFPRRVDEIRGGRIDGAERIQMRKNLGKRIKKSKKEESKKQSKNLGRKN